MSPPQSAIVFGPTGGVGSWIAASAFEHGVSKVFLAMRDPSKKLPKELGNLETKHPSSFERVKADLMEPETVLDAVKKTGAKAAFIYLMFGMQDHMRGTIEALHKGGIEHVVFLSSISVEVQGKALLEYPEHQAVPRMHGRVEYALEEVFGMDGGFTVLRPAFFMTNLAGDKDAMNAGDVKVFRDKEAFVDMIVPEQIGRIGGIYLAQGREDRSKSERIPLYGKENILLLDAYGVVKQTLNKDFKITPVDVDGFIDSLVEDRKLPREFATIVARSYDGNKHLLKGHQYKEGAQNVKKLTGQEPIGLVEWLKANADKFD